MYQFGRCNLLSACAVRAQLGFSEASGLTARHEQHRPHDLGNVRVGFGNGSDQVRDHGRVQSG